MATLDWPDALIPQRATIVSLGAGEQFKSPYNGTLQVVDYVAERWMLSVTLPQARRVNAGLVEAFFMRLRGGVNRVAAWHFGRPTPIGTLRGSPTLQSTVNRGATSIPVSNGGAGATLAAGDMLGLGGQLLMVAENVTFNGSGTATVPIVHRIRATINAGAAVAWNRPTAEFAMPAWQAGVTHFPGGVDAAAFDFEEVW